MKPSNRPTPLILALLITLALVVSIAAGCGSSGQQYASAPTQTESVAASSSGGNFGRSDVARSSADDGSSREQSPINGRKLKRNAWMNLEVDDEEDIAPTLDRAKRAARSADGYIQQETSNSVTMMVPTERAESILDELETLGEVTDRSVHVVDVTSQYVDLQIRIDNLEKTRQRLQQLLAQSVGVEDVLAVEKELSRVTVELERLEGQMRTMSRDTTYASVRLTVEDAITPGPIGWVFYGGYKAVKWLFVWD